MLTEKILPEDVTKKIVETSKNVIAYGNLFKKKRLINRIFWLIILVLSTGLMFYYSYTGIDSYLHYDVVTIVKREYDQPAVFPTVTICSRTPNYFGTYNFTQLVANGKSFFILF